MMKEPMPQEIMVWEIIPAIRREFARSMIDDNNLTQRESARLLRVTEAAVSQYLSSKRAKSIVLPATVMKEIKTSVKHVIKDNSLLMDEMQRICNHQDVQEIMCDLHKSSCGNLPKSCEVCLR
jgi:predicted transcriptional regulator